MSAARSKMPLPGAPGAERGGEVSDTLLREPDVQLSAMVPPSVRAAVRRRAAEEGTTVRSILLRLIKDAGIADIDEAEIADRRSACLRIP